MAQRSFTRHLLFVAAVFLPPSSLAAWIGYQIAGLPGAIDWLTMGMFGTWFACSGVGVLTEYLIDKKILPPPRE
jgi:hypothetical protein